MIRMPLLLPFLIPILSAAIARADPLPLEAEVPVVPSRDRAVRQGRDLAARVLDAFDDEPSVERVQRWAVGEAMAEPGRASRMLSLARARGALPLIRLRGRYEDGSGRKFDELDLQASRARDTDYTLDVWLEWDLADLASGPEAARAVREGRAITELRQGVITQVNIAYFDRRRLCSEELLAQTDEAVERTLVRRLRVQELDATLDGLTGGRWTGALAEAGVDCPPAPMGDGAPLRYDPERAPTPMGPAAGREP